MLNKDDILSYYTDENNHLYQMIGYCPYPTVLMQNVRTGQVENIVPDSLLAENYTKLVKEKQLKDIGFWTQDGEYIEDIQEVDLEKE